MLSYLLPSAVFAQSPSIFENHELRTDPDLLSKLDRADFAAISDEHWSRMDQGAVFVALSQAGCIQGKPSYPQFFLGGSDVIEGAPADGGTQFSQAVLTPLLLMAMKQPNYLRAEQEIMAASVKSESQKGNSLCNDARIKTTSLHLVQLINNRIALEASNAEWYRNGGEGRAKFTRQSIRVVSQANLPFTIYDSYDKHAQDRILQQIEDLASKNFKLIDCDYAPTKPQGDGSAEVTFWYQNVPITMADLIVVSRKHPLIRLGDLAVDRCPSTYSDAQRKLGESEKLGNCKIDFSKLPPEPLPMNERTLGSNYGRYQWALQEWAVYQSKHDPNALKQAQKSKKEILADYDKRCADLQKMCAFRDQVKSTLEVIPGGEAGPPSEASILPSGSVLRVTTTESIDLAAVQGGQLFQATLERAVQINGKEILPQGTSVFLRIVVAPYPNRPSNPNITRISVSVDHVSLNGRNYPLLTNEMFYSLPSRNSGVRQASHFDFMVQARSEN